MPENIEEILQANRDLAEEAEWLRGEVARLNTRVAQADKIIYDTAELEQLYDQLNRDYCLVLNSREELIRDYAEWMPPEDYVELAQERDAALEAAESWRLKLFACGNAADGVFPGEEPDPDEINLGRVKALREWALSVVAERDAALARIEKLEAMRPYTIDRPVVDTTPLTASLAREKALREALVELRESAEWAIDPAFSYEGRGLNCQWVFNLCGAALASNGGAE